MKDELIPDSKIPAAEPEAVARQYEGLIYKMAMRYSKIASDLGAVDIEDLLQAGNIGVLLAQKTYDPGAGSSFLTWACKYVIREQRKALGYSGSGLSVAPVLLASLDEPLSEDSDETRLDITADGRTQTADDILDRISTQQGLNEAIDRLPEVQQQIIRGSFYQEKTLLQIAGETGKSASYISAARRAALNKLRNDRRLQEYVPDYWIHVGPRRFNTTFTSAVEAAILRKEKLFDDLRGPGSYLWRAEEQNTDI